SHEIDQLAGAGEIEGLDPEDRGGLGHRLDLQHARHDRAARKVALEELLVEADRLDRVNALAELDADDAVDQQQRVAVGQGLEDSCDVERPRVAHALPPPCLSGPRPACRPAAAADPAPPRPAPGPLPAARAARAAASPAAAPAAPWV